MKYKIPKLTSLIISGVLVLACSGSMETNNADAPDSMPKKPEGPDVKIIEVFKSDGSIQCEEGEISLEEMGEELIQAGIEVISWRKDHDGLARTAVCGNSTGRINVYGIAADDGRKALELGFKIFRTRKGGSTEE
jgi:hypothetical protein